MIDKCAYCENNGGLEWHHIWPLSLGGPDEPYNMIRVCHDHHGILHAMAARGNISALTKAGLEKTREGGTVLGAPLKVEPSKLVQIVEMRRKGASYDKLSAEFGVNRVTVARLLAKWTDRLPEYEEAYTKQQAQYTAPRLQPS